MEKNFNQQLFFLQFVPNRILKDKRRKNNYMELLFSLKQKNKNKIDNFFFSILVNMKISSLINFTSFYIKTLNCFLDSAKTCFYFLKFILNY